MATTAVGYARVSSQEQKIGRTIELQVAGIEERAAAEGWELLRIERDEAKSGANGLESRSGLAAALAACEAGEASVLVIEEYARLARDLILQETIVQQLAASGVQVVALLAPEVGGDEATRTLVRQVLGAVKQYERAVIRSRMEAGRARAVAEGRRGQGGSPYGWKAAHGQLEPVEAEQTTISQMQEWVAAGCSASEVARRLNAAGVPAQRGTWHPSTVARVLRREAGRSGRR